MRVVVSFGRYMNPCDREKTLKEIQGDMWPEEPEEDIRTEASALVSGYRRLLHKPLEDFTVEDLRLMIGQRSFLKCLVPLALERLAHNPMVQGDYYPGDLLVSVLNVPREFWRETPDMYYDLRAILDGLTPTLEAIRREVASFEQRIPPSSGTGEKPS